MKQTYTRKLVLEDGTECLGYSFGAPGQKVAELVFNTSMVGYQEILSDPSYTNQAVVMTYPLIGNYGMADDDYETKTPTISALVTREYNDFPSNFRSTRTLDAVMKTYGIVGICGIDTRWLTRHIRDKGSCKVLIAEADMPITQAMEIIHSTPLPRDGVATVSCKEPWTLAVPQARYRVVAVDCGIKHNILRCLNSLGCDVTVVPWDTSAATIENLQPDGVFLSNGPGNPEDAAPVIETVRALRGKFPIFGICLGHQILCLAYGAETYKLKFGHRGGNHPVKNLQTGKIEITSQNHSYAVKAESLVGTALTATHMNLLDNTVEGVSCLRDRAFSVQYHPESAPGPEDSKYLFNTFLSMMEEGRGHA